MNILSKFLIRVIFYLKAQIKRQVYKLKKNS